MSNSRTAHKTAILVEISLADGATLFGNLFVPPQGRLTDLLNDDRDFLPVQTTAGVFMALAKTAIKQVTFPLVDAVSYQGNDPYLILGVREGVTYEELKKAYHQLCLVNHPDRIKGFGLGPDFQELATINMARISNAYSQVSRTVKAAGGNGSGADQNSDANV